MRHCVLLTSVWRREGYRDAYLTAHFEVPGEMFTLAMEAKRQRGMGVVGSTQNILDFIAAKLGAALDNPFPDRLQFVLGTETGMVTSIVRCVKSVEAAQQGCCACIALLDNDKNISA